MSGLRAEVVDGHLVMRIPTTLPEGTVLDLVIDDEGDGLTEEERQRLDDAIARGWESAKAGRVHPAEQVLAELRRRGE